MDLPFVSGSIVHPCQNGFVVLTTLLTLFLEFSIPQMIDSDRSIMYGMNGVPQNSSISSFLEGAPTHLNQHPDPDPARDVSPQPPQHYFLQRQQSTVAASAATGSGLFLHPDVGQGLVDPLRPCKIPYDMLPTHFFAPELCGPHLC